MLLIGKKLREERQRKFISINDIYEKTKIQKKYLEAIERDDFSSFPSSVHIYGYLKLYAQALKIDSNEIVENYKNNNIIKSEIIYEPLRIKNKLQFSWSYLFIPIGLIIILSMIL
ncbi:MAG: helix-turn-helix domain-containing protein [Spirochaetota bacterium]|nr:helix-turn-helix domain-containing protein [Spirochaetota bacterium]